MSALFPGDEENLAFDRAEISPPCGGANHFINWPELSALTSLMISVKRLKTNRKKFLIEIIEGLQFTVETNVLR